jgi:hypothetical protein
VALVGSTSPQVGVEYAATHFATGYDFTSTTTSGQRLNQFQLETDRFQEINTGL